MNFDPNRSLERIAKHASRVAPLLENRRDPLSLFESSDVALEEDEAQTDAASKTSDALKSGDVSVDDLVSKLNAIRAGKSFKDEAVRSALDAYVEKLDKAERSALLAYLFGIEQVVSGLVPGADATDPSAPDPSVKMQKTNDSGDQSAGKKTVKIDPVVKQKPKASAAKPPAGAEDRTPPKALPVSLEK